MLVSFTTEEYREAVVQNVERQDICLEVGCHEGLTTRIISNRCGFVVGVDKSATVVDLARRRYPGLRFEAVDGFDISQLRALSPTGSFSKVFVDIGGVAELSTVMSLVCLYYGTFKDALIVVKSKRITSFIHDVELFQTTVHQQAPGKGEEDRPSES